MRATFHIGLITNDATARLMLVVRIRGVPASNVDQETSYAEVIRNSPHPVVASSGTVPLVKPRSLPSTAFQFIIIIILGRIIKDTENVRE
jgi:hypothetical protein